MFKKIIDKVQKVFDHDITSEIKERVTNPFFVSLIISWSIWNWKVVFTFFNFDDSHTLGSKLTLIQKYWSDLGENYWKYFLINPILTAFAAIVGFALLNQIALAFIVFVRRQIRPFIYKYIGHKDIVDKETHLEVKNMLYKLREAYTELAQENSSTSVENSTLRKEKEDAKIEASGFKTELLKIKTETNNEVNRHNLKEVFNGEWYCEYIWEDGGVGEESVSIKEGNKYFSNSKHKFNLDMIEVDRKENILKFRKVGIGDDDERKVVDDLKIVNENEYSGIEDKNIYITYTRKGSDASVLKFNPQYENLNIEVGDNTRIIFEFKNNGSTPLDILSYKFYCIYNGKLFGEYDKHRYKKQVVNGTPLKDIFNVVNPLQEYFKNKQDAGIYDSEICIEYRLDGSTEVKQITRRARLVVQPAKNKIEILSATYLWPGGKLDVTENIRDIILRGFTTMIVDPGAIGVLDPAYGIVKTLKIHCKINGKEREFIHNDGTRFKIE